MKNVLRGLVIGVFMFPASVWAIIGVYLLDKLEENEHGG